MPLGNPCHAGGWHLCRKPSVGIFYVHFLRGTSLPSSCRLHATQLFLVDFDSSMWCVTEFRRFTRGVLRRHSFMRSSMELNRGVPRSAMNSRTSQCTVHSSTAMPWLKVQGISVAHFSKTLLLGAPFTRLPPVASSPACSLSRPSASSTSLERTRLAPCSSAHWSGMSGCLANPTPHT